MSFEVAQLRIPGGNKAIVAPSDHCRRSLRERSAHHEQSWQIENKVKPLAQTKSNDIVARYDTSRLSPASLFTTIVSNMQGIHVIRGPSNSALAVSLLGQMFWFR